MSEWISVEDSLPDEEYGVLVSNGRSVAAAEVVVIRDNHYFWLPWEVDSFDMQLALRPTHWMPLPKPPQGK